MARAYNYKFQKIKPVILFIWEYRCYVCGHQNTRNHVHHFNENPHDNGAHNLMVLCDIHHKMIHKNIIIDEIQYTDEVARQLWALDELWKKLG